MGRATIFTLDEHRLRRRLGALTGASTALLVADNFAEHYRGGFHSPSMWAPIALGPLATAAAALAAILPRRPVFRRALLATSVTQVAAGVIGFGFHCRGIARRPGHGPAQSLFHAWYGPPALAPLQYSALGLTGIAASTPAAWLAPILRRVGWSGLGRLYVALSTPPLWAEITYLHARGGYQNRLMLAPVTMLPAVAVASAASVGRDGAAPAHRAAATALATLGAVGTLGHLWGTARQHGGLSPRAAVFNLLTGPPPTAPLQMVATGLMVLATERPHTHRGRHGRR